MSGIRTNQIDLNLLNIFSVLLKERSVTRTAERLNVTPPAVTHSLNRLRHFLRDELFVRTGNGMQPTAFAADLGPRVEVLLQQLHSALDSREFDPAAEPRDYAISATPYSSWVLLPSLMTRFRVEAPNSMVQICPAGPKVLEDLEAGIIDVAIGVFDRVPKRFETAPLFSEELVWTVRRGIKSEGESTLEILARLPHIALGHVAANARGVSRYGDFVQRMAVDDGGAIDRELELCGLKRSIAINVPNPISALAIVAESDFAALSTRRLAERVAQTYALDILDPPYECPPVTFSMLWRKSPDPGPAAAWLRLLLSEVSEKL